MGITVREAITICGLKHGTIAAGSKGLDNTIEHVSVIEVPDSYRWFKGSELFVTAFSHFAEDPSRQLKLLDGMAAVGSTALAILQTERYIWELDPMVKARADSLEIPIILFPEHVPYIDIISPILKEISMKDSNQLSYLFKVQKELTDALLQGNSFSDLCLAASNILGNPICFVNQDFEYKAGDQTLYTQVQPLMKEQSFKTEREMQFSGHLFSYNGYTIAFQPLMSDSRENGYLIAVDQHVPFHEEHISALHQISLGFALKIQEERKIEETKRVHQRDFFEDILTAKTITSIHLERGKKLGIDLTLVSEIVVIHTFNMSTSVVWSHIPPSPDYYFYAKRDLIIFLLKRHPGPPHLLRTKITEKFNKLDMPIMMIYSPLSSGCANLSDKYEEIEEGIDILRKLEFQNIYLHIDALLCLRFIKKYGDEPLGKETVEKTIGNLIDYDREYQSDYLNTLQTILFIEDTQRVLDTLYIHRNTLMNRKKKINEILGYDMEQFPYNMNVRLAVLLWRVHKR